MTLPATCRCSRQGGGFLLPVLIAQLQLRTMQRHLSLFAIDDGSVSSSALAYNFPQCYATCRYSRQVAILWRQRAVLL